MERRGIIIILLAALTLYGFALSGCTVAVQPTSEPLPPPGPYPGEVDVSFFYNELAPYGEWFRLEGHGWVWSPYDVPPGWRPYTEGRWMYTDSGLTWVSDYEWGWAPFHYGRWFLDSQYGWVWVPGREWAPAWVVWRHGVGRVGWAPLPPRVDWHAGNLEVVISPYSWVFVKEQFLLEPRLEPHIAILARNATLIRQTQNVTNYTVVQNRVFNRSLNVDQIERGIRQPIVRYRIVDRDRAPAVRERIKGNDVYMFRHQIVETAPGRASGPAEPPKPTPGQKRTVGTSPGKPVSLPELQRQQESERRQLNTHHEAERAKLIEEHREELRTPPRGVSPGELRKEQEAERRALEDQMNQEKKVLQQRHEREQKGEFRSR